MMNNSSRSEILPKAFFRLFSKMLKCPGFETLANAVNKLNNKLECATTEMYKKKKTRAAS